MAPTPNIFNVTASHGFTVKTLWDRSVESMLWFSRNKTVFGQNLNAPLGKPNMDMKDWYQRKHFQRLTGLVLSPSRLLVWIIQKCVSLYWIESMPPVAGRRPGKAQILQIKCSLHEKTANWLFCFYNVNKGFPSLYASLTSPPPHSIPPHLFHEEK